MTSPIWFKTGDNLVTSASDSNTAGIVSGVFAGILAIVLALAAVYFYQKRRTMKLANGVAFENPSYLREVNMEHVQVGSSFLLFISFHVSDNNLNYFANLIIIFVFLISHQISAVSPTTEANGTHNSITFPSDWRQERLHSPSSLSDPSPSATEVNPSLYEELKLGHDGVGFKRLVS